uniref:Small ribosomal subunit protein uS15 N-terminal domain-containing protein n=1 Tax=Aegilops tauschii subsp. strangulata TaxID=200361 RepID=A0A453S1K3_AEGTS
ELNPSPDAMGRMHSRGKGISSSALPYKRTPPSWVKTAVADVDELITKAAKKGQMPSQIGVLLRDQHGIPLVKSVTGSKILRILKAHGQIRPLLNTIPIFLALFMLVQVC